MCWKKYDENRKEFIFRFLVVHVAYSPCIHCSPSYFYVMTLFIMNVQEVVDIREGILDATSIIEVVSKVPDFVRVNTCKEFAILGAEFLDYWEEEEASDRMGQAMLP